MKNIMLTLILLIGATAAFGQASLSSNGLPEGTFKGKGNIAGGVHTIEVRTFMEIGSLFVTVSYGGAETCFAKLSPTETPGVYQEEDSEMTDANGNPRKGCEVKGFVYLVKKGTGLTYHWGATAKEAMKKPLPVTLVKQKDKAPLAG